MVFCPKHPKEVGFNTNSLTPNLSPPTHPLNELTISESSKILGIDLKKRCKDKKWSNIGVCMG